LRRRAPQHTRALAGKARLGLWPFSLRWTSPRCCAPVSRAAMASPWRLASRTRSQRMERRPFWSASAHLATGRRSHTHASVPDCGYLVRRHPLAPARAPPWPSSPRHFTANSVPKPEPLTPLRPCAPKRTHTHASSRASSPEWAPRPPAAYCRRADPDVDLAAPVTSFLGRFPSIPSDPRGSHESSQGACCPGAVRSHRRRDHPALSVPLRHCVEHLGSRLEPWGCFAHGGPHVDVAVDNPPGSGAARHSSLEPHNCLRRVAPERIPSGSRAAGHASSHAGCSWLKATDVAASSALVADLQPASS
jgi:hypothetical protein